MENIKNTRFDVTHITELERLMYSLKYNKGYTDGGVRWSYAESNNSYICSIDIISEKRSVDSIVKYIYKFHISWNL